MILTAELVAIEFIDQDESEKDCVLKLSCEGLEDDVILTLEGGRSFKLDAADLMECVARISQRFPSRKIEEDD